MCFTAAKFVIFVAATRNDLFCLLTDARICSKVYCKVGALSCTQYCFQQDLVVFANSSLKTVTASLIVLEFLEKQEESLYIITGLKRILQFTLPAETVRHIWLSPSLFTISCFLPRLLCSVNSFLQRLYV